MTLNLSELTHALRVVQAAAPQAFTPIRTEAEYEVALTTLEDLMDAIGPNLEGTDIPHPLEPLAAALTERIAAYEEAVCPPPGKYARAGFGLLHGAARPEPDGSRGGDGH